MLEWTTAAPTQEGWYFFRSLRMSPRVIRIFTTSKNYDFGRTDTHLFAEGKGICRPLEILVRDARDPEFAGPIQEPKEAEE